MAIHPQRFIRKFEPNYTLFFKGGASSLIGILAIIRAAKNGSFQGDSLNQSLNKKVFN
jgi:hypothetical protein